MIYLPNRRKAFQGGGAGNGFLNNLAEFWDLAADVNSDSGGNNFTDTGTTTEAAATAPDGGSSREFTSGDLLEIAAGNIWASGTATAIAFWIKPTTTALANPYYQIDAGNYNFTQIRGGATTFRWAWSGGVSGTPSYSSVNVWTSVVVTSDGSGSELFLNGVSYGTSALTFSTNSAIFYVGGSGSGNFTGYITSMGIWNELWDVTKAETWHNVGSNLRYADLTS
jgi:hypothetical protein